MSVPKLFPSQEIEGQLVRSGEELGLRLTSKSLLGADLLVYWADGKQGDTAHLPKNSRLLGPLERGRTLPLPKPVRGTQGQLYIYSLAQHEIVIVSNPISFSPKESSAQ